ncbi:NEQ045 [Nanoarchaeum equitans Kin4-M]|uniref:DNA topoisomerase n=1 Tax=Nanoarchaeum equitans (strain Kin4-M) TaxID=228908 RepID=Q74N66_NANEQ|nr:NEQ045 [Nanoarchaeum equitans Kin4-M]
MIIIAEKPSVAKRITFSLTTNYKLISKNPPQYYFKIDSKPVIVIPAAGHIYNLDTNQRGYPVFDYFWNVEKGKTKFAKAFSKYKNEKEVIVATDYDLEGELIGYNILRFALNKTNAKRMVFSALTPKDLREAFFNLRESIDKNLAIAGETRHIIDWLYGINLSRALTYALRHYVKDVTLSIGRVQGPTLRLVYEREKEISNFIPEEYYRVVFIHKNYKFYYIEKLKNLERAKEIAKCKELKIVRVKEEKVYLPPPHPYNLSAIQQDAYKFYKISPKDTLLILQKLYTNGYISYPRTSSNILPESLDYRYILEKLKLWGYSYYISYLLKKPILKPNNGNIEDAHPAIYPTGIIPKGLSKKESLIYDLIVRNFIATFMDKALIIKFKVYGRCDKYLFVYEGQSYGNSSGK